MDRPEDAAPAPDSPARFGTLAERLVERVPEADLDYTPASLARLDEVLAGLPADRRRGDDEGDPAPVATVGSYFGETLCESADAAWVETEPGHWAVVVYGDSVTVNAFAVARDAVREPPALARAYETAVDAAE